jgi:hypothetical protein
MAITQQTTPEELNVAYENLMFIWDRLERLPDRAIVDIVNGTFSQWQDWFYGNYEQWDMSQYPIWIERYHILDQVIDEASRLTTVLPEPPQEQPIGPIVELPPEYVYGRVPPPIKPAGIPKSVMWAIAAVLATIFLSKAA